MIQIGDSVCGPIRDLLIWLVKHDKISLDQKIQDYHFHEWYFLIDSKMESIPENLMADVKIDQNKVICNCHWSVIEFKKC
ncbi:MAG: hypothetical protein JNL57_01630 [Bacteroidetes bacterium]|nr:hypothetical protein [Bacteroidota bacterium]